MYPPPPGYRVKRLSHFVLTNKVCVVFPQDPVLNVRLKFCTIPPLLKSLLKLPTDRHLLQQLEQCIRKLLSSEKEPDVCTAVREVLLCHHCC